jgi:redox-sensitive bicupin YhaK (pirin superfamily)
VIPSAGLPQWPPFELVAETIATPRRRLPPHGHKNVEVFTYIIEGSAFYEFGTGPAEPSGPGATRLLAAPTPVSHSITPGKGGTVRWFAAVTTLPGGRLEAPRLQSGQSVEGSVQADGTTLRRLIGPGTPLASLVGLEGEAIEFQSAGTSFQRVGHGRVAVCYALSGRGTVDNDALNGGEAAFVEDAAGFALHGQPGFRVVLLTAPK